MYWNFKIDVRSVILLLGEGAKHFIVKANFDDVGCTFKHEFSGKAFYCRASFQGFCAFYSLRPVHKS